MDNLNRKIKCAIFTLTVCLIAFFGFSKAGVLFIDDSSNVITVSTSKKKFDPKNYVASVLSITDTVKQEETTKVVETSKVTTTTTIPTTIITTTQPELSYGGQTLSQIAEKLNNKFAGTLTGMGEMMARLSIEKGMDPYLLAAISVHETAFGKSNAAMNKYNFGGIMCSGKLCTYPSVEVGITKFVDVVYRNYFSKGLTTPEAMNSKYAASPTWAQKVNYHYNALKN